MASDRPSVYQHLFAGVSGGLLSTVILYPLELLKIRMQVVESAKSPYRSFSSAFRTVIKGEGVNGLYKGMLPACIAAAGAWGGYFFFYEHAKKRMLANNDDKPLGVGAHLYAGTEAGAIVACMFNPFWLIRTRLALQGTVSRETQYKGLIDAFVKIFREEGIRGLYKGLGPALLLTSHGAIQFAAYEELKVICSKFRVDAGDQPMIVSMVTGGLSKIVASTVTYPYQVVKSRLQQGQTMSITSTVAAAVAAPATTTATISNGTSGSSNSKTIGSTSTTAATSSGPGTSATTTATRSVHSATVLDGVARTRLTHEYTGTIDCIIKIWKYEGMVGYFRGLVPNLLRVAPSAAITFVTYEECLKLQQRWNESS